MQGQLVITYPHSCTLSLGNLDEIDPLFWPPEHTSACKEVFEPKILWEKYGIVDSVTVSQTYPSPVFRVSLTTLPAIY